MTEPKDTRIAIIGISSILPGGENVNECWETIRNGLDKISELPSDRVDVTAYYNPKKGVKDKIYCKRGGFIPDFDFDAREFGMNMFQVEDADTNQTLTLLKVKEAFEDAGVKPFTKEKKNVGVVLGIGGGQKASNEFYSRLNYTVVDKILRKIGLNDDEVDNAVEKFKANFPEWRLDSFPGFLGNVTAGRCTNVFNLSGMNCVVDAACASSLTALKVAIDELLYGNCDEMICGATCTDNSIGMYMAFSKTPVFSTDPSLTSYDSGTKGMLIGEGSVMLLLKRYADAVRDGDEIHATILGVASSSDGKASGIYSPTIDGQELAINRAMEKAGVKPSDVSLVEGHGTGTPVGDRIELTALKNVFKGDSKTTTESVAVGSIKSQIGHLKSVAGLAGLVKVVMALKHKVIPASIHVKNPPLLFDDTKIQDSALYINTELRPWFTDNAKSRIAGISSFGFGGANYHCVLQEAEVEQTKPYRMHDLAQPVLLSANSASALATVLKAELKAIESSPGEGYTGLIAFRKKFALRPISANAARLGFLAESKDQVVTVLKASLDKLVSKADSKSWTLLREGCSFRANGIATKGKVAAVFSGQGSQYVNMFKSVANNWPTFREEIALMDKVSEKVCSVRTSKVIYPRNPYQAEGELSNQEISSVRNAQISTVACSIGAFNIFKKAAFAPDFVAGHSLGEFSALYASGVIDDSAKVYDIVCNRAKIMESNSKTSSSDGAMIAVIGKNASKIAIKNSNVWVANHNGPDQVVLTGTATDIEKESKLLESKFKVVRLNCSDAFHSKFMQKSNDEFTRSLRTQTFKKPSTARMFSNVSGKEYGQSSSAAKAALEKHMVSSVQFEKEILEMYNAGARVFVEFGPRQAVAKLVESILKDKSDEVFTFAVNPTSRGDSDTFIRQCAVKMAVLGVPLNGFDNWALENPFKIKQASRKKTTLRLSAATYVSKKAIKNREAIMNDGFKVSKTGTISKAPVRDTKVEQKLQEELKAVKSEKTALQRELKIAVQDAEKLRKRLSVAETASVAASGRDDTFEMNALKQHREQILAMLGDYDKMIDTISQVDRTEVEDKIETPVVHSTSSNKKVDAGLLEKAEEVVLQVLAEKTGYDVEMIESDMELETELGIDSIKRVEILSEVQNLLDVEAKDVDALSRTRTVGEVVDAMKAEISSSSPTSLPVETSTRPVQVEPVKAKDKALLNKAEQVVLQVLAEKTGYEIEMIESDMELETELGIDSIKRVEILSEVQNILNIEAKDVDALSRTRTVEEVVTAMKQEITGVSAAPEQATNDAPVVATSNANVEEASRVVLQVLAEKTGYDVEMIEEDMELETELGIDSIKRVEILSEVQNLLDVEAKDVDALSRTRTVGEVIQAMKNEVSSSPATSAPVVSTPSPATSASPALLKKAEEVVLQVLAEKTGYDVEMIELDMELETELGIDSIKRVEILSEVQNLLDVEAKDVDALSRTRTVGEVIEAMKAEISGAGGSAPSGSTTVAAVTPAQTSAAASPELLAKAEEVVLQVLAEKTGYDVEMIELDMELETELGIDSIKRVEILSEVQNLLDVEAKDVDALSRTRTVGEVIDAMKAEISPSGSTTAAAVVATPSATTSTASPALLKKAEEVVLQVLAEKTGYDVEMIELDMELETELGIDSIKRVEILSEVQNLLDVEAKDVDALSRTRTVGEVIDAMKAEISGGSPSVPAAEVNTQSTTSSSGSSFVVVPTNDEDDLLRKAERSVLKVLAEKTGYDEEMIELDMELETELGIDSIKRVEILSEVQALLDVEAKDVDALSRTRTVGEVIDAMKKEISVTSVKASGNVSKAPASAANSALLKKAAEVVLQVLAEKTGYDVEMIELDMELETELGIDSIKRVEILSEVQTLLDVEAKDVDALSRTRTVGEVIDAMKAEISGNDVSEVASTSNSPVVSCDFDFKSTGPDDLLRAPACNSLNLSFPEVIQLDSPTKSVSPSINLNHIVVASSSGSSTSKALSQHLKNIHPTAKVTTISNKGSEESLKSAVSSLPANSISAVVYLHADEPVSNALMLAKHIKPKLATKANQFVIVVRGNGKLGYFSPSESTTTAFEVDSVEKYALCGLAKTMSLEWPETKSKLVDISVTTDDATLASQVVSELSDTNKLRVEVGYLDGLRFGVIQKGLVSSEVPATKAITSDDVWLVAGGARGITPLCIREMARLVKAGNGTGRFLLMGRSKLKALPKWAESFKSASEVDTKAIQKAAIAFVKSQGKKPKPSELRSLVGGVASTLEVQQNIDAIGAHCSGNVEYISCDITDQSSVKSTISSLQSRGIKVTGIFHASGVLRDKLILQKSLDDFKLVYNTKVLGFSNILKSLQSCGLSQNLRHVVLFSSLAGFYGNAGQSDYSMANEVLNKIAHQLNVSKEFNITARVMDFGPWDGGMVSPALKKHFQENNVQIIDRDGGATSVAKMLLNSTPTQILVGNWGLVPTKPESSSNSFEIKFHAKDFLKDHSIHGKVVLPFTFTLSTIIEQVLGIYSGFYVEEVKGCKLFKGISFASSDDTVTCKLEVVEVSSGIISAKLSQIDSNSGRAAPSYHVDLKLSPKLVSLDSARSWNVNVQGTELTKEQCYDNKALFHGKCFQSITGAKMNTSEGSIVAKVDLREFPTVPVESLLLDTIFQCALVLSDKAVDKRSLPSNLTDVSVSTDLFNGSRGLDNCYVCLKRTSGESESVWKFDFSVQDDVVLCQGKGAVVLNEGLKF